MKRLWLLMLLFAFGCGDMTAEEIKKTLPLGYEVLCSLNGDKYMLSYPGRNWKSVSVWKSKREVVDFAIYWERHRHDPIIRESGKYVWEICGD